jgi:hypothetical protein
VPIEKGEEWGRAGTLPEGAPVATSDAQAAALVASRHNTIGLDDGDLARTLGIRKPYDRSSPKQLVPVDALQVELDDGTTYTCLAHAVIGNLVRDNHVVAIMNAAFLGKRNIAPRAHPGDGKADVVTLKLGPGDRFKALQRMATGSHLPHPGIEVRRLTEGFLDLGRRRQVQIDGESCGRSATLKFNVVPDSIVIAVS